MSKIKSASLTIQDVQAAHQAAADENTKANAVYEALRERVARDIKLAEALADLLLCIQSAITNPDRMHEAFERFSAELEPTANSYGYTLADHPQRRDLVVIVPLES